MDRFTLRRHRKRRGLTVGLLVRALVWAMGAAAAEPVSLTVLYTADLHGHIPPLDFVRGTHVPWGLALCADLIRKERRRDPELILLDGGDTIQGSPLMVLAARAGPDTIHPMARVMNELGYDGMVVGNHEFDFGLETLQRFRSAARFPLLAANVVADQPGKGFPGVLMKTVRGVSVGIVGLTTPGTPFWVPAQAIAGLRFEEAIPAAKSAVSTLRRQGADVILAVCHAGVHRVPRDPESAASWATDPSTWSGVGLVPSERVNFVLPLAREVPDLDVIFCAHTHQTIPEARVGNVLLAQPSFWGRGLSRVTLRVQDGRVIEKQGEFLSVSGCVPDDRLLQLIQPEVAATLVYLTSTVGTATAEFPGGPEARMYDNPLTDFLCWVQLEMARRGGHPAEVSAASLFSDEARLQPGPIRVADLYAVYPFENTLCVLEVTGTILRRVLEWNARYWRGWKAGDAPVQDPRRLVAEGVPDYQWDMYSGLEYVIDVSRPVGARIVDLRWKGRDLRPDDRIRIALNSHRASGGGGFTMFREGRLLWESSRTIREALVEMVAERRTLSPGDFHKRNWRLIPEVVPVRQVSDPQASLAPPNPSGGRKRSHSPSVLLRGSEGLFSWRAAIPCHILRERPGLPALLFVPEGFDGVESSSAHGRVQAKNDPYCHADAEGEGQAVERDDGRHPREPGDESGNHHAQTDARCATETREHHRLRKKLGHDLTASGSDRAPDADFAGSLRHRGEHDIHDSDAPDQQADAGDGTQHDIEGALRGFGLAEKGQRDGDPIVGLTVKSP